MADPVVSVSIVGDKEVSKLLKQLGPLGKKILREQIKDTSYKIRDRYKQQVRKHKKSGQLENSITADSDSSWDSASIGSDLLYALFLEIGTRAHGPVQAKFLHWIGEDGQDVWAKWVRGIPAMPYLANATAGATAKTDEELLHRIDKAIDKQ